MVVAFIGMRLFLSRDWLRVFGPIRKLFQNAAAALLAVVLIGLPRGRVRNGHWGRILGVGIRPVGGRTKTRRDPMLRRRAQDGYCCAAHLC